MSNYESEEACYQKSFYKTKHKYRYGFGIIVKWSIINTDSYLSCATETIMASSYLCFQKLLSTGVIGARVVEIRLIEVIGHLFTRNKFDIFH
jgi:hypothetical protein